MPFQCLDRPRKRYCPNKQTWAECDCGYGYGVDDFAKRHPSNYNRYHKADDSVHGKGSTDEQIVRLRL